MSPHAHATINGTGWVFALIATLIYSTNSPVARTAILAGLEPTTLVAARFLIGVLLFGVTLLCTNLGRPQGKQHPFDAMVFGLLVGWCDQWFDDAQFHWGIVRLSASVATLISLALTPIFTLVLLRLRGEALTQRNLLRLALSLVGLYFLVGFGGELDGLGVLLTILGSLLFALHMVLVQWYLSRYNTWMVTATLIFAAAVPAVALWGYNGANFYVPGTVGWTAILIQGIASSFIARVLTYAALHRIGGAQMALLSPLEAALAVLWSMLWLNEMIVGRQWVGIGLILIEHAAGGAVGRNRIARYVTSYRVGSVCIQRCDVLCGASCVSKVTIS